MNVQVILEMLHKSTARYRSSTCVLILIICEICKFAFAADGHLQCSKDWRSGARIYLNCYYNTSTCSTNNDLTVFYKNGVNSCSTSNANCYNNSKLYSTEKCWCETVNSTFVRFVYPFWADPYVHNGTWTCGRDCGGSGIIPISQNFTSDATCKNEVIGVPVVEPRVCDSGDNTTALKEPYRNETVYLNCDKPKVDNTWKQETIAFLVLFIIFFLVSVVLASYIIWERCKHCKADRKQKITTQQNSSNAAAHPDHDPTASSKPRK